MTIAAGVAIAEAIQAATGLVTRVKWPNDIYAGDRKLAGILAEATGGAAGLLVGLPVRPARGADAKVAGLLALTGTNAAWGQKTANAFQLAWEIINQRGGVKALGGAKVAYTMADTESRPEVAGSQMERLLQGGHAAVIGCNQSAASVVVSQIGERARVPFITPTDVDPLITGRGFKYSFRLPPLIDAYAKDLLGFAAEMGKATGSPARKLAVLLHRLWINGEVYDPFYQAQPQRVKAVSA